MKRLFYYARLNSDNVCVGFASYPTLMKDVEGIVNIQDYNESYLYKKYTNGVWSQETFEPSIPLELQEKLEVLEETVATMSLERVQLSNQITQLDGTIMELTSIIAMFQGGK